MAVWGRGSVSGCTHGDERQRREGAYLSACTSCGSTNSKSVSLSWRSCSTANRRTNWSPNLSSSSSMASTGRLFFFQLATRRCASRTCWLRHQVTDLRNLGMASGRFVIWRR